MHIEIRRTSPVIGLIAVAVLMQGGVSRLGAAPPDAAGRRAAAPEVSPDVNNALLLPHDRQVDQWLDAARRSKESGDFGTATVLLLRILNAEDESFVPVVAQPTMVPAREAAVQMASLLPDDARDRFEAEFDRSAREHWDAAKQDGSAGAIAAFAMRYRASLPGLEALQLLSALHRDAGHHEQAAMAWLAVAGHRRASPGQRAVARVAHIESLLAAGRLEAAENAARVPQWIEAAAGETVLIAGKRVVPQEWIGGRLARARQASDPVKLSVVKDDSSARPALQPVWSRNTSTVPELQKSTAQIQRYFRDQGVVSSQAIRPIVAGKLVLTRTMQELVAFDAGSGETLWSVPNHEYAWITKHAAFLDNISFRTVTASAWHRRTEADSVFGAMATNATLVVVVQEPDRSSVEFPLSNGQPRGASQPVAGTRWNRLCGYEISNGQLRWQVGGAPTGPADLFGGVMFLGSPLFVDDLLFIVARRDDELCLLAMDHLTGHLRWSVTLGVLPPYLSDAVSRRRIACSVMLSDGRLICTTADGTLAAVNPTTRSVEWAYRYPVLQHEPPVRTANGAAASLFPDVWWNEWREVTCLTATAPGRDSGHDSERGGRIILLASPDSDQLHAVCSSDGTALWSVHRSGALHFAGVAGDKAIVIEPMAVRAHDLLTGRLAWRSDTGEVSGRGAIVGTQLFQPRRAGGLAIVDLTDGTQRPGLIRTDVAPDAAFGSLVPCDGGWITQTGTSLQRLPLLETVRQSVEARWETQRSEHVALELARLDLQSGDPSAARRHLAGVDSFEAKSLRREAILAILQSPSTGPHRDPGKPPVDRMDSVDRMALGRELLNLCDPGEERLLALRGLGDAARVANDPVGAMTLFLDALDLADSIGPRSIADWSADAVSVRSVRPDRILLGSIQRILDEAHELNPVGGSPLLKELEHLLEARLADALRNEDPFAVQRLIDRLLPLEWARRALLSHPAEALYARPLQKVEPVLLSAAGSRDRATSARAVEQLIAIQTQSGWRSNAESLQRRMLAEHAGTPLSQGQALPVMLASNPEQAELRRRLLAPVPDPWPSFGGSPNVEREARRHHDVYQIPVQINTEPGSPLEQLDVVVDRLGRRVRFAADGHSGTWEIVLPGSPKTLRARFADLDQVEAHGVGRLLVLRVGSEVFGILPFNERGEPRAALSTLQFDMASRNGELPSEAWWYQEPVPARVGIRHEGSRVVDGLGRPFAGLGAVRAGYLCFRSHSKLVVIDTQTGRRLWERFDLPPNCQILGDDDCVYVWRTDEQSLQVLSSIDGREMREVSWNVPPEEVLMHRGSLVWSVVRKPVTIVELHDARHGASHGAAVWSRRFPVNSVPFAMDQTTIGVIEPGGLLHLLAADTGSPLGEAITVEVPGRIERVVSLHDDQRWYVAISGPVPRLPILQGDQPWGGARVAFVNGWLYGIDRRTAAIEWRRFLDSEPLPRVASRVVPLFVQMWRRPAVDGGSGGPGMGIMRMIDKRTGGEVLLHRDPQLQPYFNVLPTENHEGLEVHTEHESYRLTAF
jgi:outer membrane protein assembly factor BamB